MALDLNQFWRPAEYLTDLLIRLIVLRQPMLSRHIVWQSRLDLNQQPTESKSVALPLCYCSTVWWTGMDLHHRHHALQACALLTELPVQRLTIFLDGQQDLNTKFRNKKMAEDSNSLAEPSVFKTLDQLFLKHGAGISTRQIDFQSVKLVTKWLQGLDSNQQPPAYETGKLPIATPCYFSPTITKLVV